MALFSRTKTPTTVSEAMAGFAELKEQLVEIVRLNVYKCSESEQNIVAAKRHAEEVEKIETENMAAADAEIERANKALKGIDALFGDA